MPLFLRRTFVGVLLAIAISASSCTLPQSDPTGFFTLHDAPQPGHNRISQYFSVEVTGGVVTARSIRYYHHPDGGQKSELIGADLFPVMASRQTAYAISDDGKRFLYFHNRELKEGVTKESGLYLFTHGDGDKITYRRAYNNHNPSEKLPKNAVAFGKIPPESHIFLKDEPTYVRTTEGEEYVYVWIPSDARDSSTAKRRPCEDIVNIAVRSSGAHPSIRWYDETKVPYKEAALCLHMMDSAYIPLRAYLSSGHYRFIRECRDTHYGMNVTLRLFEHYMKGESSVRMETTGQSYVGRKSVNIPVGKKFLVVGSYLRVEGDFIKKEVYGHTVHEMADDLQKIASCKTAR